MDWSLRESEGRAEIYVNQPRDSRGLYRAWAVGPGGRCALGTLTPQGDRLVLRRTLGIEALRQKGCWPVTSVVCDLSFPFQRPEAPPPGWACPPGDLPWADETIREAVHRSRRPFFQRSGPGFALAYPLDCRGPFPLPPLFCFARVRCLAGRPYWVFSFDGDGAPAFADA